MKTREILSAEKIRAEQSELTTLRLADSFGAFVLIIYILWIKKQELNEWQLQVLSFDAVLSIVVCELVLFRSLLSKDFAGHEKPE